MRLKLLDHSLFLGLGDEARRQFEVLNRAGVQSLALQVHLARLHRLEGHPQEALAVLNAIWDRVDEMPNVVWLRGRVHLDLDHLKEAEQDFVKALDQTPNDETLHFILAEVYRRMGDSEKSKFHETEYARLHQQNLERH